MAAYFQLFPERLAPDIEADGMLPYFIMHALPPGISGLLVTAVFAAAMSSMDSGINSLATVIINDFVRPWRDKRSGRVHEIALARLLTAVLGVLATLAAMMAARIGGIVEMWMKVMGLFAAPILSIFVLGLFTRRARFSGWLIGALCGIALTIYLQQVQGDRLMPIWHFPLSFVTTTVVGYSVSWMFQRWDKR